MQTIDLTNRLDQLGATLEEINKKQAQHEEIMRKLLQSRQENNMKQTSVNNETQTNIEDINSIPLNQFMDNLQDVRRQINVMKNQFAEQQIRLRNQLTKLRFHIQDELEQKIKIEEELKLLQTKQFRLQQTQMVQKNNLINALNKNDFNGKKSPQTISNFTVPSIIQFKVYIYIKQFNQKDNAKGYQYEEDDLNLDMTSKSKIQFQTNDYINTILGREMDNNQFKQNFQVQGVTELNFSTYQTKQIQMESAFSRSSLFQNTNDKYDYLLQELEKID